MDSGEGSAPGGDRSAEGLRWVGPWGAGRLGAQGEGKASQEDGQTEMLGLSSKGFGEPWKVLRDGWQGQIWFEKLPLAA